MGLQNRECDYSIFYNNTICYNKQIEKYNETPITLCEGCKECKEYEKR